MEITRQNACSAVVVPWLGPVLLLALAVRVAWALAIPVHPVSDSAIYADFARNLASGHGYVFQPGGLPTAYWPVGTSAVYALIFMVFGDSYVPIVILNITLSLAIIFLVARLASQWFHPQAGTMAALILAVWPTLIQFTTLLGSELLFGFLVTLALYVWAAQDLSWRLRGVLFGILIGLSSLVRPTALPLVMLYPLLDVLRGKQIRGSLLSGAVAALALAACLFPWSLRNYRVFGEFVLISTNGPANLWMGNHPGTDGGYAPLPESVKGMSETDRSRVLKREAVDWIRQDPVRYVKFVMLRLVKTHASETIGVHWNELSIRERFGERAIWPLKLLSTVYWWLALAAAILGVGLMARRDGCWSTLTHPAFVTIAFFAAVHALIVHQDRYHLAEVPMLATFAGCSVACLLRRGHPSNSAVLLTTARRMNPGVQRKPGNS